MKDSGQQSTRDILSNGNTTLGIELGSTRIKAVLIGANQQPLATGGHSWENTLDGKIWTYPLDEVWSGVQSCVADLHHDVEQRYGVPLQKLKALGISGMMHGYLVFDADGNLLVPFRTWRNNITEPASEQLTNLFQYPVPQRWSIAHLYQAILNGEEHVNNIAYMTTLSGYVHNQLTGRQVMGVGEASGMFPIDLAKGSFQREMMDSFDDLVRDQGFSWKLEDILPEVLCAGEEAGALSEAGALLLDPTGKLSSDVPCCPPEGDAGTGMVATNSVAVRTGNVSAGTSVFAMLVLEKELTRVHQEIDLVTTPDGKLVAMAHSNNCTSDYDAWVTLFGEVAQALGADVPVAKLYDTLLSAALEGDADGGGLLSYGYISGEHVTGFNEGRPLFARSSNSRFTLANVMRTHLFSALCALRTGLNILTDEEGVVVDEIRGHGGFFKTAIVGQRIMAAATRTPVSVLETAGEGGAWGIALLAAFMVRENKNQTLPSFLEQVFANDLSKAVEPDPEDMEGFDQFFQRYHKGLPIEQAAVSTLG